MEMGKNKYYENLKMQLYPALLYHQLGVNGKVSGSIYAAGEIKNALCVVHGAIGCGYHYRYSARTRHRPNFNVLSSDLKEKEIIYGGEEKLLHTLIKAYETDHPDLIVVIPTPVCDIIQDDLEAVLKEAKETYHIPVVLSKSELFSHRDKSYARKRLKALSMQKVNEAKAIDLDITGCGYSETLYGLVEQVMRPQKPVHKRVSIESIGWGADGDRRLEEVSLFLSKGGVEVFCYFPSATLTQIEQMPSVSLNIVKRVHWAKQMRERFGTPLLHINQNDRYIGLQGIKTFYQDIGNALDMGPEMKEQIAQREKEVLLAVKDAKESLSKPCVYVITNAIVGLPALLRRYKEDYHLQVVGCSITLSDTFRRMNGIHEHILNNFLDKIQTAMDRYYPGISWHFNPDFETLKGEISHADVVMGTDNFMYENLGLPLLSPGHDEPQYSFESYERSVRILSEKMKHLQTHPHMLLNKMNFQLEEYPLLNQAPLLKAKKMWHKMWLERGMQDEV